MIPSKDNTVFTGGGKMGFEVVEILCFVEVNFDILYFSSAELCMYGFVAYN